MCKEKVVPETIKIRVIHLHRGNSSNRKRHGHAYVTIAQAIDKETGTIIKTRKAFCSKKDNPSRKIGRQVAVGRVLKDIDQDVEMMEVVKAFGLREDLESFMEV